MFVKTTAKMRKTFEAGPLLIMFNAGIFIYVSALQSAEPLPSEDALCVTRTGVSTFKRDGTAMCLPHLHERILLNLLHRNDRLGLPVSLKQRLMSLSVGVGSHVRRCNTRCVSKITERKTLTRDSRI